jgi:hypothetical protein
MTELELERLIMEMIRRKNAAPEGSAAHRFALRQLCGIRYSHELAGGIIEDLDVAWGTYCHPP